MRSVTLKELYAWIKDNSHRTWQISNFCKDRATLEIKYLNFSLDTRDMTVWRVEATGLGGKPTIAIRDDNDEDGKTVLDGMNEALIRSGVEPK